MTDDSVSCQRQFCRICATLAHALPPDQCWEWPTANEQGYGIVWHDGRRQYAHRAMYAHEVGELVKGMTIDHVKARGCRSRACVNPAHLEQVTNAENQRRKRKRDQ